MIAVLAGCGGSDAEPGGSDAEPAASAQGGGFRLAVLSVGSGTDGSFGQAWVEATERTASALGDVETQFVGDLYQPDQYLSQGGSFGSAKFDMVMIAHGAMAPVALQLAKRFPDTTFCVAPVPAEPSGDRPPNSCIIDAEQQIGAFRSGVLAGIATKSNVVGSVMSSDFPAITRQVEAFELGARCVNADVRVLNEQTNSDADAALAKTATAAEMRRGADVIMGATGPAMTGIFEAAKSRPGTYAIGQYVDSASVAPDVVLASNIVNFQEVLPAVVEQAVDGGLPDSHFEVYGIDADVPVGRLAVNEELMKDLSPDATAANERVQEAIGSGKIKIPPTSKIQKLGAARTIDVASLGCKPGR
ncbi:MAG: BMP family lipoprotein [Solirubrobacteraceae bacterium]